ncbi:hypothetical protein X474_12510 [Dethiosulfatarculus sandiegensis]|uniref:Uncharacterized protein n=1 Tax=Dethiosulfatarculus sandiegensis TaxID=1429043 RepID=A0A0D2JEA5_9BACT|nr:hypothetical protein X474_12510 [Dethiosulfatarculus sandiegensis]
MGGDGRISLDFFGRLKKSFTVFIEQTPPRLEMAAFVF